MDENENQNGAQNVQQNQPVGGETSSAESVQVDTPAPESGGVELVENSANYAEIVEQWWQDHFPGSVLGRYTDAWNYVHEAKEALKRRLGAL